ncbi:MAG TPA: class I SAM-dependent methyltransferase [Streptosporangiaceae bacterium]|nr:class I SAM-dependent methyltransferase [Streptosporangiaceae bacterium]
MPLPTAERNSFAQDLFTPLPARYDRLAELLSFGQNGRWRRAMVDQVVPPADPDVPPADQVVPSAGGVVPSAGGVVLDVASGTAGVAIQLASRASAQVVGVDLTEQMLRRGAKNVASAGLAGRIGLVAGRAEQLPFPDASFDALTFTYLLRYVEDPQATLTELARVVKPGGRVASLEFCVPPSPLWHAAWWAYTRTLLPLGGLVTGGREWLTVGRFLGPNISSHYRRYPVSWTVAAWRAAGFTDVGFKLMSLGGGLVMWGTRSGG